MDNTLAIEVRNLVKRYGNLTAVDNINFTVNRGEVFGMLGPNGAGKTTTAECIAGLRQPDGGDITVLGMKVGPDTHRIKARIGVQLQTAALYPLLTVREVLDLFASFYPNQKKRVNLDELVALVDLQEKAKTYTKALSGGQRQRLSVALALVNDPEIIFLDEPTTGLDPQARRSMWDIISRFRDQGKTIFLTTHYMEEAERLCDRVAVVERGRIIALGSPADLITTHFKESAIEVQTPASPADTILSNLPGVSHAQRENGRLTLFTVAVLATMAGLMELSESGQVTFKDVTMRRATLEDVFLKLTGRRIRD
ncbi:MAG: ABC transporter ATP-binding protein [Anaerolineae bacterium]|nr:ABC transporter ATP-binding protein [Anaerolineae bacterium]